MLTSLVSLQQGNAKKSDKLIKLNNIEEQNFNEIFRKDVTYDNIKSHEKPGIHNFSEKHIFGKTTGWESNPSPPAFLGLR